MDFLKNELIKVSHKGEFTLSSGKKSDFYVDVKSLMFDAKLINILGHTMFKAIVKNWGRQIGAVGGLELGSVPLSTAISYRSYTYDSSNSINHFVLRKEKRSHGTSQVIEGLNNIRHKRIVIVDDVLTTGNSLVKTYDIVKKYCTVLGAVVVVDREETNLRNLPFEVISLYKKKELLNN